MVEIKNLDDLKKTWSLRPFWELTVKIYRKLKQLLLSNNKLSTHEIRFVLNWTKG